MHRSHGPGRGGQCEPRTRKRPPRAGASIARSAAVQSRSRNASQTTGGGATPAAAAATVTAASTSARGGAASHVARSLRPPSASKVTSSDCAPANALSSAAADARGARKLAVQAQTAAFSCIALRLPSL